ncbi:MAG: hypothetical protein KKD35_07180, partial [Elusimicrobia bacterium]|nr:hypothetical protein [Elusimicrobiota bacterium]
MNKRKKILLIVPRFPFPPLSGGEKWIANLIEFLSVDFGIFLFSFFSDNMEKQQTAIAMDIERKYLKKVFLIKKPAIAKKSPIPYLPKMYKCEDAANFLNKISKEIKFDMAHIIFFEMAQYASALPSSLPKLYTEIDASYFFPWKFFLRESAGFKGLFKISEILKTLKYIKKYYPLFKAATAIALKDGKHISEYFKDKPLYYTPNAIKIKDFENKDTTVKKKNQILFLGHYPHFPNEDAAIRLAEKIYPKIKRVIPTAKLCLAGSFPTEKIKKLSNENI